MGPTTDGVEDGGGAGPRVAHRRGVGAGRPSTEKGRGSIGVVGWEEEKGETKKKIKKKKRKKKEGDWLGPKPQPT